MPAPRLTGGDTPENPGNPRTFPSIFNQMADLIDQMEDRLLGLEATSAVPFASTSLMIVEDPDGGGWSNDAPADRVDGEHPIWFVATNTTDPANPASATVGIDTPSNIRGWDIWGPVNGAFYYWNVAEGLWSEMAVPFVDPDPGDGGGEPPPDPLIPSQVTGLNRTARTETTITVTWDQVAESGDPDFVGYELQRRPAGGASWEWATVYSGTAITFQITNLAVASNHDIRCRAVGDGAGPWSATITEATLSSDVPVGDPLLYEATTQGGGGDDHAVVSRNASWSTMRGGSNLFRSGGEYPMDGPDYSSGEWWATQLFMEFDTQQVGEDDVIEKVLLRIGLYDDEGSFLDWSMRVRKNITWTHPVGTPDWTPASQLNNFPIVGTYPMAGHVTGAEMFIELDPSVIEVGGITRLFIHGDLIENADAPSMDGRFIRLSRPDTATGLEPMLQIAVNGYDLQQGQTGGGTDPGGDPEGPQAAPVLSASNILTNSVDLAWTSVADADTYELQRNGTTIQDTAALSRDDTGLAEGTQYAYRVRGKNAAGVGPWSATQNVTTQTSGGGGGEEAFMMGFTESEIQALPMSGSGWSNLQSRSEQSINVNLSLSGISGEDANVAFAAALRYVRTGSSTYRNKVVNAIDDLVNYGSYDYQAAFRKIAGYAMAADLVNYRPSSVVDFFDNIRYQQLTGVSRWHSIWHGAWDCSNNHGTLARAAYTACCLFIGDQSSTSPSSDPGPASGRGQPAGLNMALKFMHGFLGNRSEYSSRPAGTWNSYGGFGLVASSGYHADILTWTDRGSSDWVPLAPASDRLQKDGGMITDVSRGDPTHVPYSESGGAPNWSSGGIMYQYTAAQGLMMDAVMLQAHMNPNLWTYEDSALRRWRDLMARYGANHPYSITRWTDPLLNGIYGTNFPATPAGGYGYGFSDWLFQD